jgi:predicted nucleic acid-binding protein
MKIIIHDANVLIDLVAGDLLEPWCKLKFRMMTTSLVWHEVNRKEQKPRLRRVVERGDFSVVPIGAEALAEVAILQIDLPAGLSLEDASVLFLASHEGAILLTGDGALRRCASERGIAVHGMLWVLDQLVARKVLAAGVAADRLERLQKVGLSRLPKEECNQRIRRWRMS